MKTFDELADEAYIAWEEYSTTEVFESRHWYEEAMNEFIDEYIFNYFEGREEY